MQSTLTMQSFQPIPQVLHHGHSSVFLMDDGQCMECRRGTLRCFSIPNPMIWNTVHDWIANCSMMEFDVHWRPIPHHFNQDQVWMYQWFEESTLTPVYDYTGLYSLQPSQMPTILAINANTGYMSPFFMNMESGTFWLEGQTFTSFAKAPFPISQMWRLEMGNYYRIY